MSEPRKITAEEAHLLWVRSGRDSWLFVNAERAAAQAGAPWSFEVDGDWLRIFQGGQQLAALAPVGEP